MKRFYSVTLIDEKLGRVKFVMPKSGMNGLIIYGGDCPKTFNSILRKMKLVEKCECGCNRWMLTPKGDKFVKEVFQGVFQRCQITI